MNLGKRNKEVARFEPKDITVIQEVELSAKEKWVSGGIAPTIILSFSPVISGISYLSGMPLDRILLAGGITFVFSAAFSAFGAKTMLWDDKRRLIAKNLQEDPTGQQIYDAGKAMDKAKKGRILVNSFAIKDPVEVNVETWRKAGGAVPESEATHTIKHYLVKEKGNYRLEQEVIVSTETVWDLSADALVEVYGVQESKNSRKALA